MKKLFSFITLILVFSCSPYNDVEWRKKTDNPEFIHRSIKKITDVIVHDIFSPPVASRIYAYTAIAGYEAAIPGDSNYVSLTGQLNGFRRLAFHKKEKAICYTLASVQSILTVGKALVFSEDKITEFHAALMKEIRETGIPEEVFTNSLQYGDQVAKHVLDWAAKDNYKQTRTFPKYSIPEAISAWKPTPPAYMDAVEPHWGKIRTFVIDSAQQFKPSRPTKFSLEKSSQFYKEAVEVATIGKNLTAEQIEIANFWDCNPFKMNITGHVMYATKKISPGGHWINITRLACRKSKADFLKTIESYACVSVCMADCFISCWDEKFRSNVIRPESYINQFIDESWQPLLQTPPFPEYTSGHSVVSAASAVILSQIFGNNFSFNDSTEMEFRLPARKFDSFNEAAAEAAISRLYGGIHYRPSIENGVTEGKAIGTFIIEKLRTRKAPAPVIATNNTK